MTNKRKQSGSPRLSPRLSAIAAAVSPGCIPADIGTDHALLPVSLVLKGSVSRAYACDIGAGPLSRAAAHIRACGLEGKVETRLCDGLSGLKPGEADCVVIAGMGGELMVRILSDAENLRSHEGTGFYDTVKEWILSPHTEHRAVRHYLRTHGLRLVSERLVEEDHKFYLILKAIPGDGNAPYEASQRAGFSEEAAECFGPCLLQEPTLVLHRFLTARLRLLTRAEQVLRCASDPGSGPGSDPGSQRKKKRAAALSKQCNLLRELLQKTKAVSGTHMDSENL